MDPEAVADDLDGGRRIVVDHERPPEEGGAGRADVGHEVSVVGQRSLVPRPDEQVAAALRPVGARQPEVGDPAEPHVVDGAEDPGRRPEGGHVDHHRAVGQVDEADEVEGVAVGGQEQRGRVHQRGEEEDVVVLDPDGVEPCSHRGHGRPRERPVERIDAVHEVEVVVQQVSGRRRRGTVVELQRPEATLDLVRCRDRRQGLRDTPLWSRRSWTRSFSRSMTHTAWVGCLPAIIRDPAVRVIPRIV